MRSALLLLFCACSSGGSGTDAGSDGSLEASAVDSSSEAGIDAATDGCAMTWSKCQNCIANGCSMELVACTMDTQCHTDIQSVASCVNTCASSCRDYLQGTTAGANLAGCMTTSCPNDCP